MRIQPINLYNNLNANPLRKQQPALQASTPDMFVKSPSFGNHRQLMQFFEGEIKYTPENVKKFNSILENTDLSGELLKSLKFKAKELASYTNQNFAFNYDFLLRTQQRNEVLSHNHSLLYQMFSCLPIIKFGEDASSNVEELLEYPKFWLGSPYDSLKRLTNESLEEGNLPLLKTLYKQRDYLKKYFKDENKYNQTITKALITSLDNNPKADINALDNKGKTLLMNAVDDLDLEMFQYLVNRDDVDLNAVNKRGENILMQLLRKSPYISKEEFKNKALKIFDILSEVPPERFDINYINYNYELVYEEEPYSVLSKILKTFHFASDRELIDSVLKFPNLNANLNPSGELPLIFKAFQWYTHDESIEKLLTHPNTDLTLISKNFDIEELYKKRIELDENDIRLISKCLNKTAFSDIKKIYDKNGFLTLDEIEKFVDCDKKDNQLCHEKINIVGENIGHLLAEIVVDENNTKEMQQLKRIFKQLQTCYYDFNSKDDFGVTPLDKAIECENKTLITMFRIFSD